MAERDEGFLGRWSRLKRTAQEPRDAPESDVAVDEVPAPGAAGAPLAETPQQPMADEPELPPIDSLTKDSDFTPFLRAGVAPELRQQALHKLWRSDPVLANLDGLLEYGEDYSLPFKTPQLVVTAYQVGKGMVRSALDDSAAADAPPDETAAALAAAPEAQQDEIDSARAKDTSRDAAAVARPHDESEG